MNEQRSGYFHTVPVVLAQVGVIEVLIVLAVQQGIMLLWGEGMCI